MRQNAKLYPLAGLGPAVIRAGAIAAAALALATMALPAAAATEAMAAEAVQWPVWVERGGERRPLVAGEPLLGRDRIATGDGGRVLLRLADGSGVKLGENAQLELKGLATDRGGVLNAALDVGRGAFRFTTGLFRGALKQRSVTVSVATITAGIRGTDVWGKSDDQRDLVCLLEGRISVSHPKVTEPQVMDRPLTFYTADRGKAPGEVASVDAAQVAKWAEETEVQPGQGVGRAGGAWQLVLATAPTSAAALAIVDGARAVGVPTRIRPQRDGEQQVYEVRVPGLPSEAEARALAARLAAQLKLGEIRVRR